MAILGYSWFAHVSITSRPAGTQKVTLSPVSSALKGPWDNCWENPAETIETQAEGQVRKVQWANPDRISQLSKGRVGVIREARAEAETRGKASTFLKGSF